MSGVELEVRGLADELNTADRSHVGEVEYLSHESIPESSATGAGTHDHIEHDSELAAIRDRSSERHEFSLLEKTNRRASGDDVLDIVAGAMAAPPLAGKQIEYAVDVFLADGSDHVDIHSLSLSARRTARLDRGTSMRDQ